MYKHSLEALNERGQNLFILVEENLEWKDIPNLLFAIKRLRKQLISLKAAAQAPLQVELLQIRNEFEQLETISEQHENKLKTRVLQEHQFGLERRDSAIQEAKEAHAKNDLEGVQQAMLKASEAELSLPTGISLRQQVKIEISDKSQIPIAYLKTDDAKIRAAKVEIPGVIRRHELTVAVATEGEDEDE
jgi:hypothetical protein